MDRPNKPPPVETKQSSIGGPRKSLPRAEKGTMKVVDHVIKEEAAVLLYACLKLVDHPDKVVRKEWGTFMRPKIEDVVSKLGFDNDRIKIAGSNMALKAIFEARYFQNLNDVKNQHARVETAYRRRMSSALNEVSETPPYDIGEPEDEGTEAGDNDSRVTRGGSANKRAREEDDLEHAADELLQCVRRLKSVETLDEGAP